MSPAHKPEKGAYEVLQLLQRRGWSLIRCHDIRNVIDVLQDGSASDCRATPLGIADVRELVDVRLEGFLCVVGGVHEGLGRGVAEILGVPLAGLAQGLFELDGLEESLLESSGYWDGVLYGRCYCGGSSGNAVEQGQVMASRYLRKPI